MLIKKMLSKKKVTVKSKQIEFFETVMRSLIIIMCTKKQKEKFERRFCKKGGYKEKQTKYIVELQKKGPLF
jgi:hypothetical protein